MSETPRGDERFQHLRDRIQREIVERRIPSLAIAVTQGSTILWEEGFGWADRARRIAATPHTLYALASISKPITATALMILQERGLLDLDRPIDDYLGDSKLRAWVGDASDATVRRVANHTAGLPLHYQFFYEDEPYVRPPMGETIRRYGNLVTAPGERFMYSNLGYGLLSHVIERLAGKRYADVLREEVFLPLGMPHASVDVGPGLEPFQAQRYAPDGQRLPFYETDHPGASAVYCSAHELARFGLFHLKRHLDDQQTILSDQTLDEMHAPTARQSKTERYGIGWRIYEEFDDYPMIGHTGGMDGVNTMLKLVPAGQIVIAILTNTSGNRDLEDQLVADVLSALLPGFAEHYAGGRTHQQPQQAEASAMGFTPDARLLGAWHGQVHTYEGDVPLALECKATGDVHAQLGTQLKTLVNRAHFSDPSFEGVMLGEIGTPDASRYPHHLHLDLTLRDDRLTGTVIAIPIKKKMPGSRLGFALSHWVELRKAH